MAKKTLVIGASPKPWRFAYKASLALQQDGHPIELIGSRIGEMLGIDIQTGFPRLEDIDTVTLYVGTKNQLGELQEYIQELKPKRVIFNPGTENPQFSSLLAAQGVETVNGCTLVMLASNRY